MGRVAADSAADASQAEFELREQAGRRGANTVLLIADKGVIHGKAYFCHPQNSGGLPQPFATGSGTDGTYGPNVPTIGYSSPGAPTSVAK